MRRATLEVVWLHFIAMIVDISLKVDQVDRHEVESDDASVCPSYLDIKTADRWNLEPAETDREGSAADPRNRASIHTGGLFFSTMRGCVGDRENRSLHWQSDILLTEAALLAGKCTLADFLVWCHICKLPCLKYVIIRNNRNNT